MTCGNCAEAKRPSPKPEKLFIVFNPTGPTAPVKTHPTHKQAAGAAWQMAKLHPGQTFYIMRKSGRPAFVEPPASGIEGEAGDPQGLHPEGESSAPERGDALDPKGQQP